MYIYNQVQVGIKSQFRMTYMQLTTFENRQTSQKLSKVRDSLDLLHMLETPTCFLKFSIHTYIYIYRPKSFLVAGVRPRSPSFV